MGAQQLKFPVNFMTALACRSLSSRCRCLDLIGGVYLAALPSESASSLNEACLKMFLRYMLLTGHTNLFVIMSVGS